MKFCLLALLFTALAASAAELPATAAPGRSLENPHSQINKLKTTEETIAGSGESSEEYDDDDDDWDDADDWEEEEGSGDDDSDEDDEDDDDDWDSNWDADDYFDETSTVSSTTPRPFGSSSDDIHFDDDNSDKMDEDELYEYYNEQYEEDYDDEGADDIIVDGDGDDGDEAVIEVKFEDDVGAPTSHDEDAVNVSEATPFSKLSYVYILLASFLVAFTLVLMLFVVCRRASAERREKRLKQLKPFVVSDFKQPPPQNNIVKSYQRVPTSAKEFLASDYHFKPYSSPTAMENAAARDTHEPLMA